MVSMKDIAAKCGVSVATVSKALNNHSDIGEETKAMVRQIAKDMGYHPNVSARALKTNRTYNLGVLYSDNAKSGLTHDYFASVIEHFRLTAENEGYDITFLNNSGKRKDKMSYLAHCRYRGLDGVVVVNAEYNDPEVVELMQSDIPLVLVDYIYNERISVVSDNVEGMLALTDYICQCGHRKIAYLYGESSAVTRNRLTSFYSCLEKYQIEVLDEYIREAQYRNSYIAGVITNELLDLPEPPTCIIYADDFSAIGGMNAIKDRGLKIPEDISIVGYDGILIASQIEPVLTTYKQNTRKIGKLAASKLIELIEKPKTTIATTYTVEGQLVEGRSVGRPKEKHNIQGEY